MVNYLQNNYDFGDFSICHSRASGNPVLNILNLDSHFHGNDNHSLTSFAHNEAWHHQVDGSLVVPVFPARILMYFSRGPPIKKARRHVVEQVHNVLIV